MAPNKDFPSEIKGNEEWQVSGSGLFLDFFPKSFCSDKISNLKRDQSLLETVGIKVWVSSLVQSLYFEFCGFTEGQKIQQSNCMYETGK